MSRLLFEEPLVKNSHYMKNFRLEKAVYLAVGFPFLAMALLCLGYSLYGLSVAMFALFIMMIVYWRWTIRRDRQYLAIYEDKIRYKKAFPSKEVELSLTPSQYKIRLHRPLPKSGYTVTFLFMDQQDNILFQYKAVSLFPSLYKAPKHDWETALYAIGCEVDDPEEIIVNRHA